VAHDPFAHPVRSQQVRWQVVDEEGILVNLESGFYFSLNPVALFIWNLCDGENTVGRILDGIVEGFDVDRDVAQRDLEAFLGQLQAEGLIEGLEPEPPAAG
jgi:hypothetical protein